MSEWLVACGGLTPPPRWRGRAVELDVSKGADPQKRVNLELDDIRGRLVDDPPDVLVDALEVAAYVFSADRLISRGSPQMHRMGSDWRRRLRFRIPVRTPEVWNRPETRSALIEALSFLSEDEFDFEFVPGSASGGISPYLGFSDPDAQVISPDNVVVFSGGLDSLAGAIQQLLVDRSNVVLVTHKSSTTLARLQDELVQDLRGRVARGQLFYTPVWVRKGKHEPKEYSQRTRSFLFATLGVAIARMFGRDSVLMFENGITTFNLPLSEHVLGSRASRTTHPRSLALFERFFSLLLDRQVTLANPFLWKTKSEVVETIAERGCADLIGETVSCARVRDVSMTGKQCGVCSQCIERRFAILAAGLESSDPEDGYAVDVFRGAHERAQDLTMMEQYVLRARSLATMTEHAFLAAYGQVFRALPYLPGSQDENARRIFDLHCRHGRSVVDVINRELQKSATLDAALELPKTSLLAMISAPVALEGAHVDPTEQEPRPSAAAAMDRSSVQDRRFMLAIDDRTQSAFFNGGPMLRGNGYKLLRALAEQRRQEFSKELPAEEYAYIATRSLCTRLKIDDATLRQWVHRARQSLEQQFLRSLDYSPDEEDVFQSGGPWKGYRLSPHLVLVEPAQIGQTTKVSRPSPQNVTTPAQRH